MFEARGKGWTALMGSASKMSLAVGLVFLGMASSASAAATGLGGLISYTVTPDPWTDSMQGQTATVTATGTSDSLVSLALISYKTTGPTVGPMHIGPQKLNAIDQVQLNGRETKTLRVAIPDCFYQVDFIDGSGLTEQEIYVAQFKKGWIQAVVGGDTKCDYNPIDPGPDPVDPPVTPDPNDPNTPYVPPVLPPVGGGSVGGAGTPPVNTPKAIVRACSAVKATSYRVRAKQRNTITVRVTTTSTTKPKVTLKGAGVNASKRVTSKKTAIFRVKPKRAGSIRVTASGCSKVASVRVLSAKRSQSSGSAPTFTG